MIESRELKEYLVVPPIAEGNPSAKLAIKLQAEAAGISTIDVDLKLMASLAGAAHGRITEDPDQAAKYTENSEDERVGLKARIFARMCALELAAAALSNGRPDARFNFFQEHPLLGMTDYIADFLRAERIRLVVPDVNPKESGVIAVRNHLEKASFVVWNRDAEKELRGMGLDVELRKPFMLDGLRSGDPNFNEPGSKLVVKGSGSGMPEEWEDKIFDCLDEAESRDWSMHTQRNRVINGNGVPLLPIRHSRIRSFYRALGGATERVVCYPSEMVGVMADLNERGVRAQMITLPPRGDHERRNLEFAIEHGLVFGQMAFKGVNLIPGLRVVEPSELIGIIGKDKPKDTWRSGIVGTEPFWEAA